MANQAQNIVIIPMNASKIYRNKGFVSQSSHRNEKNFPIKLHPLNNFGRFSQSKDLNNKQKINVQNAEVRSNEDKTLTERLPQNALSADHSHIDDENMRGSKLTTKEDSLILYESKQSGPDSQSFEGSYENMNIPSDKDKIAIKNEDTQIRAPHMLYKKNIKQKKNTKQKLRASLPKQMETSPNSRLPNIQTAKGI